MPTRRQAGTTMTRAQKVAQLPTLAVGRVSQALAGALATGRVSHAYLFAVVSRGFLAHEGGPGVATAAALSFAKRLNCESPVGDTACGRCLSCRLIDDANHPDVRIVAPDGLSIKIDQIRGIKKDVSYRPRRDGGFRVVILENAERMTVEAQNSFLRLLEEPPGNTVFLLVTTNPSALLPTVRSRCQFIRVCGDKTEMGERFREFLGLVRRASTLSPLDVLREAEAVERKLQAGEAGDRPRRELEAALVAAVMWYRDVLVFRATGNAELADAADATIPGDKPLELSKDAWSYEAEEILRMIDRIEETRQQVRKNANTRLALEAMLFALRSEKSRALREERRAGLAEREGV